MKPILSVVAVVVLGLVLVPGRVVAVQDAGTGTVVINMEPGQVVLEFVGQITAPSMRSAPNAVSTTVAKLSGRALGGSFVTAFTPSGQKIPFPVELAHRHCAYKIASSRDLRGDRYGAMDATTVAKARDTAAF